MLNVPRFPNDCKVCVFIGKDGPYDTYRCEGAIAEGKVWRWGPDDQWTSMAKYAEEQRAELTDRALERYAEAEACIALAIREFDGGKGLSDLVNSMLSRNTIAYVKTYLRAAYNRFAHFNTEQLEFEIADVKIDPTGCWVYAEVVRRGSLLRPQMEYDTIPLVMTHRPFAEHFAPS